ncbi:MAG: ATP-binding cassette domain-containing protein [Clostridiales bacterium]|nr:ATP-binding cassette domain-containing protein [Clostridiales bacterium]
MSENEKRKVLLSLRNVSVKFNVRGRILTAIRNVSLDIYENEAIAIVGESGSGKSVLTKTFAGMLDANGFIPEGSVIFADDDLSQTNVKLTPANQRLLNHLMNTYYRYAVNTRGAAEYRKIEEKKAAIRSAKGLSEEEETEFRARIKELQDDRVDTNNYLLTLDRHSAKDQPEIKKCQDKIQSLIQQEGELTSKRAQLIRSRTESYQHDAARQAADKKELDMLSALRQQKIRTPDNPQNPHGLSDEAVDRCNSLAYDVLLSVGRYPIKDKIKYVYKLNKQIRQAMIQGEDLDSKEVRRSIIQTCALYVEFRQLNKAENQLEGYAVIDCANVKYTNDWQQIRGRRIATVFQDPMTSLNPVIPIGKQIMTVILKHQKCSTAEAKKRTLEIMDKVGIPEPEKRFDDYPFQYSGGMRQRIVIAIALSCQPKILICDEPTTALDVTIQAQIIRLIKDLQKDLGFTTVYITHDLGVVANVAERVAVLYAGQIVELGTVEDVFYDPKHPYTWALLSSLPQLTPRDSELFSIPGTPPSLYNKIVGDAFAPRNQYAMAIDLKEEPPMFQVSDTHFAKTWLLDPRAPKIETPEIIQNLHEKMVKVYGDEEGVAQ